MSGFVFILSLLPLVDDICVPSGDSRDASGDGGEPVLPGLPDDEALPILLWQHGKQICHAQAAVQAFGGRSGAVEESGQF